MTTCQLHRKLDQLLFKHELLVKNPNDFETNKDLIDEVTNQITQIIKELEVRYDQK